MLFYNIENNGFLYNLYKEEFESNDIFLKRIWYISKKNPKNLKEFEKYKNLSLIWRNMKFYNMTYSKEIENIID
jgi:hypothetical protein